MASPYPLPPGCIFREDFKSPALAAQNGLVITGNPIAAGVLRMATGTQIFAPELKSVRPNTFTLMADVSATGFIGSYRTLVRSLSGVDILHFGFDNTTNRMYWYDGGLRYSSVFALKRSLFAVSITGGLASFYQDGALLGTSGANLNKSTATTLVTIGSTSTLNNQLFTDPVHSLRMYYYAMSAEEIAADYRTIRGNQA
jgi:hypothetical protein